MVEVIGYIFVVVCFENLKHLNINTRINQDFEIQMKTV